MVPRGAEELIKMRLSGSRPVLPITILVGEYKDPSWWRYTNTAGLVEILVRPEDNIERLDFRCLTSLSTIMILFEYGKRDIRLYERIQKYADEILVLCPEFDVDLGWRWIKKYGRLEINDSKHIDEYRAAEIERGKAAHRNDQAGYKAATDKENNLKERFPWLRY